MEAWKTKNVQVASLHLDPKNPRLGREVLARAPRDIVQHLFQHDKAMELAESIATRGFFANEPLLAIKENDQLVVIEGNRRLAALKALREPNLLEGASQRSIEKLSRRISDPQSIATVPVTLAPTRRATDKLVAGRHVGTPVLAWEAENRASFILEKLEEGYTNDQLRDQLGFTLSDIQKARQIRAIADMARSLDLPEEIKAKLDNPRAKIFSTLERVFDSSVGREFLKVEPDPDHGLRGKTTSKEFVKGYTKLVADVALGKTSSRTLNNNEDIKNYFKSWDKKLLPTEKRGSFVPSEIIVGDSIASPELVASKPAPQKKSQPSSNSVIPKSFHVRINNDRLREIRQELVKLKREDFPNSGAVLLRVFFELAASNYLERKGIMKEIVDQAGGKNLINGKPTMRQMVPHLVKVAKKKLSPSDANRVEKAIKYDGAAPFTISDLHSFVHQLHELPSPRDIQQFWARTEPLFKLMLEEDIETSPL
ncbi:ParB N-terminal domain-containing protein [Dongia sp.]|uniref:ParB N-terminal domain-containing protein n=1 Tax=Dongia sp. TaxID=1977262 RepID=UPI0035AE7F9F